MVAAAQKNQLTEPHPFVDKHQMANGVDDALRIINTSIEYLSDWELTPQQIKNVTLNAQMALALLKGYTQAQQGA